MKYLKPYKIFESEEMRWFPTITETLEDILLDLNDIGFRTMVDVITNTPYPRTVGSNKYMIDVDISIGDGEEFIENEEQYIELKNALLRIREYINSNHSEWKMNDSPPADTVPIVSGIYRLLDMDNDKAIRRLNIACGQMQLLGVDVPIIKLKLERVNSFNEARNVDQDISIEREKEIYNIVDDCLLDVTDNDNTFRIVRGLADDYERINMDNGLLGMELHVTLHNYNSFNLKEILDPINNLISQLSGEHIELKEISYKYNENEKNKHGYGSRWYQMSMDPIDNMISDNTILPNDLVLKSIRLVFN